MVDKINEWRIYTPLLLGCLSISGVVMGYLIVDKLNVMNDKSDRLFSIVGEIKLSVGDYEIRAGERFARIEQELYDLKKPNQ